MEQRDQAKKQSTWISAEAIGNNIDLLTQILLRVPAKPLIKFKCVSKQWLSLISGPQFCLSHTRHHHTPYPTPTALLLMDDSSFNPNPEFQIVPLKDDTISCDYLNAPCLYIKQSCNDLLLFSSTSNTAIIPKVKEDTYYICNPTTKQFKKLSFPSYQFRNSVVALNLAFDPLKSPHYKVISIGKVKEHSACKFRIDMYASETDSWSLLGITFNGPYGIEFNDAVFCNGAIHWNSNDVNSLYFDVDNECVKTMPMPNIPRELRYFRKVRYFGESCGHLHLIVTYNPDPLKFDVLEMAADYSQWFVRYHVDLDALKIPIPGFDLHHEWHYLFSVLSVIRAEKEEETMVVLHVDGKAVSYNPYNGTSKKLCDLQKSAILNRTAAWRNAYQCFEILSCV